MDLGENWRAPDGVFALLHEPLLVVDADLSVVAANPAFTATFREQKACPGEDLFELGAGVWRRPGLRAQLQAVLRTGSPLSDLDVTHELAERRRLVLLNARRMTSPDGEPLLLLGLRDITDHEQRIRAAERERQLDSAARELDQLAQSIAHDLRAPLRAVTGFLTVLLEDHGAILGPDGTSVVDRVMNNAVRLGDMIDGMVRLLRATNKPLERSRVSMAALVRGVVAAARAAQPERQLDVRIDEMPDVVCDASALRQVWEHLLSNALKSTRHARAAEIRVYGHEEHGDAVYCIQDNGAGFEMRYAERLFSIFQRLHKPAEFEGLGVGLSIVRRIIVRHGGRVWAEARTDGGARFYFSLPMLAADSAHAPSPPQPSRPAPAAP